MDFFALVQRHGQFSQQWLFLYIDYMPVAFFGISWGATGDGMNQTKITSCRYIDVVQSPTFARAYIFHFLFYFIFTASTT